MGFFLHFFRFLFIVHQLFSSNRLNVRSAVTISQIRRNTWLNDCSLRGTFVEAFKILDFIARDFLPASSPRQDYEEREASLMTKHVILPDQCSLFARAIFIDRRKEKHTFYCSAGSPVFYSFSLIENGIFSHNSMEKKMREFEDHRWFIYFFSSPLIFTWEPNK